MFLVKEKVEIGELKLKKWFIVLMLSNRRQNCPNEVDVPLEMENLISASRTSYWIFLDGFIEE